MNLAVFLYHAVRVYYRRRSNRKVIGWFIAVEHEIETSSYRVPEGTYKTHRVTVNSEGFLTEAGIDIVRDHLSRPECQP